MMTRINPEGQPRPASASSGTLADVIRAPAAPPGVVVLDTVHDTSDSKRREVLTLEEDLWLSTADGRFNAPIIPVHVGEAPSMQIFYVHKNVLIKVKPFESALCGEFREATTQELHLPEEDPATFHFLVAYLYEGTYRPIKPAAAALDPAVDKGKGKETAQSDTESSDPSWAGNSSDSSAPSRFRRRRRLREERAAEAFRSKHPGRHRPDCACPQCESSYAPACTRCGLRPQQNNGYRGPPPASRPPGRRMPPGVVEVVNINPDARARATAIPPPPPGIRLVPQVESSRISGEDMRTWLLAYHLTLEVYMLAHRFLIPEFKMVVARHAIDMLESAGPDAAHPEILHKCLKLVDHVGESDQLVKMILARVGFLQPLLWRRFPGETSEFLVGNPEVAAAILRETVVRREGELGVRSLPSMERWDDGLTERRDGVRSAGMGPLQFPTGWGG